VRIPLRDDPTRALTHDELVAQAVQYLEYRGWLVIVTHDARHRPAEPGVTDLIAMRRGANLLVEIKIDDDVLRPSRSPSPTGRSPEGWSRTSSEHSRS
jgi:hypothetical protein